MSEKPKKKGAGGGGRAAAAAKEQPAKKGAAEAVQEPPAPSRTKGLYQKEVVPHLMKRFQYTSTMQVPRLQKIVVNMGVGDALQNIKLLDAATSELTAITGQKPAIRRARKSIANFKLRAGLPIGTMVTLRGPRMWEFLDRLMDIAIPKIRDFRGLPTKSFDGRGNYTFGLKEQVIFPEIKYDKVEKIRGMDITLVTSAKTDEEGMELLQALRWPFRQK
ncbi:MAG: 50S ribosomal protein L5 [Candidatus Eisenbacteria bacterium]|nr:50S ribosomal protein L5 [Candidatus Eisenbacteria bacterium]